MKTIFNPEYILKLEIDRILILRKDDYRAKNDVSDKDLVLHPIQAIILSAFDGRSRDKVISELSELLNLSKTELNQFVDERLVEHKGDIAFRNKNSESIYAFPENALINVNDEYIPPKRKYTLNDICEYYNETESFDIRFKRCATPTDLILIINTLCYTDCIYCYADRKKAVDCKIPLERLYEIIEEAAKLDVRSFNITGGEWVLYKHWDKLFKKLYRSGFEPFISTKVPLQESDIIKFKEIGGKDMQVSLDTLIPSHLSKQLLVNKQYQEKIQNTLKLLEKHEIKIFIHTIITKVNNSKEDIKSVYEFIKNLNNVAKWRLDPVAPSGYKSDEQHNDFMIENYNSQLVDYIQGLEKKNLPFEISFNGEISSLDDVENSIKEFNENKNVCSGNFSALIILPNGDVTICEELYWHPHFILGNVKKQSIQEIWNSEKALKLYNITQQEHRTESACHSCLDFNDCRDYKQICYRDVVKKFGVDNWDYPDSGCPASKNQVI